ncbi:MAG: CDP-alcohol phosphatidyltransferase family protein [Candidatus Binatia bacterium]
MTGVRRHAADSITLLRLALAVPFALAAWHAAHGGAAWPAALLYAGIALSDFLDGRLARRFGVVSPRGQALDHCTDLAFILLALATYVALGRVPWWVPAAIAASFTAYRLDSLSCGTAPAPLIGSRIGHVGGVANYGVVGMLVLDQCLGPSWLPAELLRGVFVAVPIYSGLSIAARLNARRSRIRTAPDRCWRPARTCRAGKTD